MEWWVPFTAKFKATISILRKSAAREGQFPSSDQRRKNEFVCSASTSSWPHPHHAVPDISREREREREREENWRLSQKKLGSNLLPRRRMELAEEKRKGKNLPPHFPLV